MSETFRRGEVELLLAEALADRDQMWLQKLEDRDEEWGEQVRTAIAERDAEWEAQARAAVVEAVARARGTGAASQSPTAC